MTTQTQEAQARAVFRKWYTENSRRALTMTNEEFAHAAWSARPHSDVGDGRDQGIEEAAELLEQEECRAFMKGDRKLAVEFGRCASAVRALIDAPRAEVQP